MANIIWTQYFYSAQAWRIAGCACEYRIKRRTEVKLQSAEVQRNRYYNKAGKPDSQFVRPLGKKWEQTPSIQKYENTTAMNNNNSYTKQCKRKKALSGACHTLKLCSSSHFGTSTNEACLECEHSKPPGPVCSPGAAHRERAFISIAERGNLQSRSKLPKE